ncbi:MAG TPA: Rrf2 family transcriptional regulator [Vicinamibacterales bacterium]|nr:Rrf2 family transcriptional regulator [Vicinamibacterales bacterium]
MLRLSKKSDYALMAMKHLALRTDGGASSSAREMSEAYDIPLELLAKVLQRLVRARLLVSVQGTRGGYRLGRPATAISVADVIQAVDGPVTVTACSTDDHNCDQYSKCSIRDPLWKIKNRIYDALNTVSVAEMAAESEAPAQPQTHTVSRMVFVPPFGES